MMTIKKLNKSILVAEDNRVLADVIRFNLERGGFDVTVAYNGSIAIECLQNDPFDLLMTDYQMPVVDGAGLCRFVRQTDALQALPIVMCSAKGLELDAEQLRREWNISKLVFKPFSVRDIVSIVNELILANTCSNAVCL